MSPSVRPAREIHVTGVKINSVSHGSIAHFGDQRGRAALFNRTIAVQRAIANDTRDEYRFASYRLFDLPKPMWPAPDATLHVEPGAPPAKVGPIYVIGVTASAHLRVGDGGPLAAEARIVNIRHYNDPARTPVIPRSGADRDIR